MNSINSLIIEGNVVKDPHFKTITTGTSLCTFSIAANRFFRKNGSLDQETSYFDVETWAELADICHTRAKKGSPVRIVGRIKQYRWESPEGDRYSAIRIVAEHVEFKTKAQVENEVDDLVEDPNVSEEQVAERMATAEYAVF
ncbi:MAG: single-stranded DNA-binding protein [Spirochaetaceae bacterium]|nr:single-stranded DNA-binding protein [Spirochaetaceae bacterium]